MTQSNYWKYCQECGIFSKEGAVANRIKGFGKVGDIDDDIRIRIKETTVWRKWIRAAVVDPVG
jgi:hypothetical protein